MLKSAGLASRLLGAFFFAAVLFGAGAAPARADLIEGTDYTVLNPPQPVDVKGGKIEVIEFFWYGCPHCYAFEPVLKKWLKTLPPDVVFRRIPADFGRWTPAVKTFYALQSLGQEERLHSQFFDAIHIDRLNPNDKDEIANWMQKMGVDKRKFLDAYNSFGVQIQAQRAMQIAEGYKLTGVPTMAIQGMYTTSNSQTGSFEALTSAVDQLIEKVRRQQGRK